MVTVIEQTNAEQESNTTESDTQILAPATGTLISNDILHKAKPHFVYAATILLLGFSCLGYLVFKDYQASEVKNNTRQALKKCLAEEYEYSVDECFKLFPVK